MSTPFSTLFSLFSLLFHYYFTTLINSVSVNISKPPTNYLSGSIRHSFDRILQVFSSSVPQDLLNLYNLIFSREKNNISLTSADFPAKNSRFQAVFAFCVILCSPEGKKSGKSSVFPVISILSECTPLRLSVH